MSEIRLAFSSGVEFSALNDHASINGWTATTPSDYPITSPEVREADAYIFTWHVNDSVTARFVDDEVTEVPYIVFSGHPLHEESSSLAEKFAVSNYQDCLRELSQNISGAQREKAIETLGVIAPRDYREDVYMAVAKELDGDTATIRIAAVSAVLQLSWPEFRELLQRVAKRDPGPNNRAIASNAMYSLPKT